MNRVKARRFGLWCLGVLGVLGPFDAAVAQAGANTAVTNELSVDSPQYKRGRLLYIQCRACHDLEAGGPRKVGPHLAGIVGRASAAVSDFGYSEALESAQLTWDAVTLDRFLQRPGDLVPGNTMAFAGIANAADRAALVTFLTVESRKLAEKP